MTAVIAKIPSEFVGWKQYKLPCGSVLEKDKRQLHLDNQNGGISSLMSFGIDLLY